MKGSPIIATAITIVVLLAIYLGIRSVLLPEGATPNTAAHHDHHGHSHDDCSECHHNIGHGHDHPHGEADHPHADEADHHDDTALETDFEIYFSSTPKTLTITQPSTGETVISTSEIDTQEWFGPGVINLDGHHIELQVDVEWLEPSEMNMVEIILNPARHASRSKTLRSSENISDIAEFQW